MISKYTHKKLTWVDLENPTEKELLHTAEEYGIPELLLEELRAQSLHSKVDVYPNFVYLVLHFPKVSSDQSEGVEQEVDFILSKDFVITTHYEFIEAIHQFSKMFEVETILEKRMNVEHAGFVFFYLTKNLYYNSRHQLHDTNTVIKETEKLIFEGKENMMVQKISNINRTLVDFKQALRFHKEILDSFAIIAKKFFGENFSYYLSDIIGEYNKTQTILDTHKEILDDLKETNDSLLATKTNTTIKTLTIITFLMSPVVLISNIFVINSTFLERKDPNVYYVVLFSMFLLCILIFMFIKKKKWL